MNSLSPTRPSPRRRLLSPVQQPVRRRQQLSPTKANASNNNFRNMVAKYSPERPTSQTVISGYPKPHVAIPKPYKRRSTQTSTEQSKGGMSLLTKAGYGVLSLGAIATAIYGYKTSGGTFPKDLFKLGGLGGGSTPDIPDIPSLADNQNVGNFSKYIKYLIGGAGAVAGGAVAVGGYNTYRNRQRPIVSTGDVGDDTSVQRNRYNQVRDLSAGYIQNNFKRNPIHDKEIEDLLSTEGGRYSPRIYTDEEYEEFLENLDSD